jgi:hypothetical protein
MYQQPAAVGFAVPGTCYGLEGLKLCVCEYHTASAWDSSGNFSQFSIVESRWSPV